MTEAVVILSMTLDEYKESIIKVERDFLATKLSSEERNRYK